MIGIYLKDELIFNKLAREARLLCSVLHREITDDSFYTSTEIASNNNIDWNYFLEASGYHEISGILYRAFKRSSFCKDIVPEDIIDKLERIFYFTWIKNMRFWDEFKFLNNIFNSEGIEHIPLKGIILDRVLYPEPGTRRMADIDILIKKDDLFKINELLIQKGYCTRRLNGLEYALKEKECFLEFNRFDKKLGIGFVLDLQWTDQVDINNPNKIALTDAFTRRKKIKIDNIDVFMLSPEDMFFNLCLHQRRFGKTIILKYLYDIALLLKKYEKKINWDFIIGKSKDYRLESLVFTTLYLTKLLLGVASPRFIIENYNVNFIKNKILVYFCVNRIFNKTKRTPHVENVGLTYILFLFLVYNRFKDVIKYIFRQKKFAKFYNLEFPSLKTNIYFIFFPFYIFLRSFANLSKKDRKG